MNPLAVALIAFTILLFLGMPVIFVMAFSSIVYCLVADKLLFLMVVVEKMFRGMDSFVLLAIPLFFVFFVICALSLSYDYVVLSLLIGLAGMIAGGLLGNYISKTMVRRMRLRSRSHSVCYRCSRCNKLFRHDEPLQD